MGLPPLQPVTMPSSLTETGGGSYVDAELPNSVNHLIQLRWFAAIGVLIVTQLVGPLFRVGVPTAQLTIIGISILVYNLILFLLERNVRKIENGARFYPRLAFAQMALDWLSIAVLIHFSGGIESPVIYFFLFHIVIVSIFFQKRQAFIFTAVAIVLLCALAGLEYFGFLPHHAIQGYLAQPLYRNELFLVGALVVFGSTALFTTYLVTGISERLRQRVAEVIELSRSLRQLTDRLRLLNESARVVSSTLELTQVLNLLVKNTAEGMGVKACSIRLLDKSGRRLDAVAAYGLSQKYLDKGPVLLSSSALSRSVLAGSTVNIPDVSKSSLLQYPEEAAREGYCSMLSAPLIGKTKVLGILRAYSDEINHFSVDDENFITTIAAQGSIAIENALAYQAIEDLESAKSAFVRTFTHELRSPVGVIYSLLKNITDGYAGEISAAQRDLLERAIRRTDFLKELIDDLLDLSAGKAQVIIEETTGPIAINPILARVMARYEIPAQDKGVSLQWAGQEDSQEAVVTASEEGLDRIFNNLVSNAVKYTPQGGKVAVRLEKSESQVSVSVEDTGIGIPEESLANLFTEFYRAPNAKEFEGKGTGLGLAIVKDTAERYGGRVTVESKLGVGSRFVVTFPVASK